MSATTGTSVVPFLTQLRQASASRAARWHHADTEPWTGADWGNAMGGECGEAQNVVKKLRRQETRTFGKDDPSYDELRGKLAEELADLICYADLLAEHYGIELAPAIAAKFNAVSEREGFPERLIVEGEVVPAFHSCSRVAWGNWCGVCGTAVRF